MHNQVLKLLQGDEEAMNWARQQMTVSQELDTTDGEDSSPISIESHINLALQDLMYDPDSNSSTEQGGISLDDYMGGRWSRSSSFN